MIQHGLLPLVFVVFILGVMGFFSPAQTGGQNAFKVGIDAITMCSNGVDFDTNLAMGNAARLVFRNSSKPMVSEQDDVTNIWLEVVPELMKYDQDTITIKAGKKIILELDNLDGMQHNLLILKPNSLEKVGAAADAMLRDPRASEKHYVPEIPEVLFSTNMLGPNEVYTLKFTAPSTPGNYPFVCTFPGHWRMMSGIMVVEKP